MSLTVAAKRTSSFKHQVDKAGLSIVLDVVAKIAGRGTCGDEDGGARSRDGCSSMTREPGKRPY